MTLTKDTKTKYELNTILLNDSLSKTEIDGLTRVKEEKTDC
ncbi:MULTISPECIES: hypothetical protein [unclassified Imperialibacter]|nr:MULTISPECIES: hypothetical protein [unclassified Imperialibacter]